MTDLPEALRSTVLTGLPPESEILFVSVHGRFAMVLSLARSGGAVHPEQMLLEQDADGRWHEGISGNGPGWCATDVEKEIGVRTIWAESEAGTTEVECRFADGRKVVSPVVHGYWFACRWDIGGDDLDQPVEVVPGP